jgi:molecular chaperone DnaK
MIKEAEAHADEAHKLRELVDTRNQAEALAYQIEKSVAENREKLDASLASTVDGRIMELRGVLESGDVGVIKEKTDALQEAWTQAASALYAQASASEPANDSGGDSDDEVVEDAEYEVVDES